MAAPLVDEHLIRLKNVILRDFVKTKLLKIWNNPETWWDNHLYDEDELVTAFLNDYNAVLLIYYQDGGNPVRPTRRQLAEIRWKMPVNQMLPSRIFAAMLDEFPHESHIGAQCAICQSPATSVCGQCGNAAYCGPDCQGEDWEVHQSICDISTGALN